jgi:hypothetical protein
MRWRATKPKLPEGGDKRTRLVFAWKPKPVEDQVVWLESYEVHESYFSPRGGGPGWWSEDKTTLYNPCYY